MSGETLRFDALQIRRAPGFEDEGFALEELSGGINLIHGPNGAGKSTTARAISQLLWPELYGGENLSLRGRFRFADAEWSVERDGTRVVHRREGEIAPQPLLPPGEDHHRYHLSLHDLLRERDEGFAAAIARESAGGYDVRRSGAILEPRAPANRRAPLTDAVHRARERYEQAMAAQRELREKEMRLQALRADKEAAEEAVRRLGVLEAAMEHARARDEELIARAQLERFPAAMDRIAGDEYDRLCGLRDRLRRIADERERGEVEARGARERLAALALPEEALRDELIRGLEHDLGRLREAEEHATRARAAVREAEAKEESARERLGGYDPSRLARVSGREIGELAAFAKKVGELEAERRGLEADLRRLEGEGPAEEVGRLEEAMRLLRCWLREPVPASPAERGGERGWGVAAVLLLGGLGGLLGVLHHPLYLAVTVVAAGLLAGLLRSRPAAGQAFDAREVHRREYGKLGLEEPAGWDPEPVERLLESLQERTIAARECVDRRRRRAEAEAQLRGIEEKERTLAPQRAKVVERLGVSAGTELPALVWLAEAVSRWQQVHEERLGAERSQVEEEAAAERIAGSLRARLAPLGFSAVATTGEIAGAIQTFRERRQEFELQRQKLASATTALTGLAREQAEREEEIGRLFTSLQLDPDSDAVVRDWCGTRAAYREARDAHQTAEGLLRAARTRLRLSGGEEALASMQLAEIEAEMDAHRERAAARDALAAEITATETLIEQSKRSQSIEAALEEVDRAEEALREAREREARSAIALELIEYLERATRDQHLPAVFRRAREIFARITHGRYELRLGREGEPEFTALDQVDRRARRLEELSSGTRVQLLLAVRVAFVEQQERGLRLPLLLDEVLGNSDDERARAIMEAAVELARDGRQIFYFTAQTDEVARWRALAAEGGLAEVAFREIDLQWVRGRERRLEIPDTPAAPRRLPAAPDGADHAEYGRRLGVPRLDRARAAAAGLHLWYLVEEPVVLHHLLSLGSERWGALQALLRDGGRPLVEETLYLELETCGRVAEHFLEAARVGVGLPVDRGVLEASGAVTATFLDRVDDLARRVRGDAHRLMEALEAGEVARFPNRRKAELRDFLVAGGYLPEEAPLGFGEIRRRVLARVAPEIAAGALSMERFDRLLTRLWVGVGGVGGGPTQPEREAPAPAV